MLKSNPKKTIAERIGELAAELRTLREEFHTSKAAIDSDMRRLRVLVKELEDGRMSDRNKPLKGDYLEGSIWSSRDRELRIARVKDVQRELAALIEGL